MEHRILKALRRILDATAFSNVDHLRDVEELLERNDGADRRAKDEAAVSAMRAHGDAPGRYDIGD